MIITVILIVIALESYFLGNLNGAIIASTRIFRKDIRNIGSGNAGLANFYRNFGIRGIAVVLVIDLGKGFIAAFLGGWLLGLTGEAEELVTIGRAFSTFCLVIGHMYPAIYQFKGGKGILVGVAGALSVDWRVGLACLIVFVIALVASKYVSLGSMLGAATFPIAMFLLDYRGMSVWLALFTVIPILIKHRENMVRIATKKEPIFELKKDVTHRLDEEF